MEETYIGRKGRSLSVYLYSMLEDGEIDIEGEAEVPERFIFICRKQHIEFFKKDKK